MNVRLGRTKKPMSAKQKAALAKAIAASAAKRRGTGKPDAPSTPRKKAADYRAAGDARAKKIGLDKSGSTARKVSKAMRGNDPSRDATSSRSNNPRTKFDRNSGNQTVTRFTDKQRASAVRKASGAKKTSSVSDMRAKLNAIPRGKDSTREGVWRQERDIMQKSLDNAKDDKERAKIESSIINGRGGWRVVNGKVVHALPNVNKALGDVKPEKPSSTTGSSDKPQVRVAASASDKKLVNDLIKMASDSTIQYSAKPNGRVAKIGNKNWVEVRAKHKDGREWDYWLAKDQGSYRGSFMDNMPKGSLDTIKPEKPSSTTGSGRSSSKPAMGTKDPGTMGVSQILKERKELIAKQNSEGLTKEEEARLKLIRAESALRHQNRKAGKGTGPTKISMAKPSDAPKNKSQKPFEEMTVAEQKKAAPELFSANGPDRNKRPQLSAEERARRERLAAEGKRIQAERKKEQLNAPKASVAESDGPSKVKQIDSAITELKSAQSSWDDRKSSAAKKKLDALRSDPLPVVANPKLTPSERRHLKDYRDYSYMINGRMRDGQRGYPAEVAIKAAINRSKLSKPVKVRRFIGKSMGASGVQTDYAKIKRQLDSGSYRDMGFMSTEHATGGNTVAQMARLWSENGRANKSDIVLEIDLPKGFNALELRLDDLKDNHLSEVLLPPGVDWDVVGKTTQDGVTVYKLRPKKGR